MRAKLFLSVFIFSFFSLYSQDRSVDLQANFGRYAKEDQFNGFTPELLIYKKGEYVDIGISTKLVHKSFNSSSDYDYILDYPHNTNVLLGEGALVNQGATSTFGNLSQPNSRFFSYNLHFYFGHTFFQNRKYNFTISAEPGVAYMDYADVIGFTIFRDNSTGNIDYIRYDYGVGRGFTWGAKFRGGFRYNFGSFYTCINYVHAAYKDFALGTINLGIGLPIL